MASATKTLSRMRNNPRDWRIEDLQMVAKAFGVEYRQHGTNHRSFRFGSGTYPVPANRPIQPIYIRGFVARIDEVKQ